MDKISVIVPVYNVEPYIRKCLDRIVNQTYANLEILLVDDGSTDNSGKICDEYEKKDNRIRVIHKANGGVSSARNVGLGSCTGSYVGFVDSDDWIEPNMYEVLYKALTDNHVELSAANYTVDTDNESMVEIGREEIPKRVLTQKEMLLYAFRNKYYAGFWTSACNKLFKADIIKKCGLLFDESLKNGEDPKFLACLIANNNNITGIFINDPFYHYYQRQNSASHSNRLTIMNDILKSLKGIIEAGDNNGFHDITIWPKRDYCYNASLLAEKALQGNDKKLSFMMCNEMKLYLKEYIEANSEYPERIERIHRLVEMSCDSGTPD